MKKRNLKRAIAKFEELAADEDYEGNRKIINLDAFLKTDLKSKKKKQKDSTVADNFESTPIKCNKNESKQQLNDSFDNQFNDDSNSSEIKTADQFLKQFLSQPLSNNNSSKKVNEKSSNKAISLLANKSTKSNSNKQTKELRTQKDGELKLKEREKQFLLSLKNQTSTIEDEEYDDEESDYDEELSNEAEELSDEELSDEESLDDESIDPESSGLIDEEQLSYLKRDQQELDNESIDDEEMSNNNYISNDLTEIKSSPLRIYSQRKVQNNKMVKHNKQSSKAVVNQANHECSLDYVTNFEYQKSATEELYKLILKSEECSYIVLSKLVKNIKQTLNQDQLPDPSKVKPFFHFTSDNQIHVTFLFINPKDIYYNPWQNIISKNYSNLSILFEKIYDLIFNFNILVKKRSVQN